MEDLERWLHPASSYVIVPLFGLANAGVVLTSGVIGDAVGSRVVLGIVAGLVIGKTAGIILATRIGEFIRIGRRPSNVTWHHVTGGSALCGIGFTVSLFIASLAFADESLTEQARIGVLFGSVCSGILGAAILRRVKGPRARTDAVD
ncbi:MAG: Na+/H+ antiporter NhaA [Actinomycetota bacterium]